MKKIFQILIIVFAGFIMNSCYYDDLVERPVPEIPEGEVVEYANDIQPIWDNKCTACHNASNPLDLRVGVSYNNLVPEYVIANNADVSLLFIQLQTGHGNTDNNEKAFIKGWINQGAKNN